MTSWILRGFPILLKRRQRANIMSIPPRWLNCPRKGKIVAGMYEYTDYLRMFSMTHSAAA